MKNAYIVAGLAYGDEGKGATVDFLCRHRDAGVVIRYNGGSQAGHNVVLPDGREHTFAQFGSGTFVPGVKTHLSRFMMVNPQNMMREEKHLRELGITDAFDRTTVDAEALIITPFHIEANQRRENARGSARHGSCGQGIGECREAHLNFGTQVLFAKDLLDKDRAMQKLRFLEDIYGQLSNGKSINDLWQEYKHWPAKIVPSYWLTGLLNLYQTCIFEGAQGVMLDETYGTAPHNTWTDCTFNNAVQLLDEAGFDGARHRIGVIRTYYTRHGEGPFPTKNHFNFPEPHNIDTGFQGNFRQGAFDHKAFQYAINVCGGVDCLAVNHVDCVAELPPDRKIWIVGYGPTHEDRTFV